MTIQNPLAGWTPSGVHFEDQNDVRDRVASFYKLGENLRSSGATEADYEAMVLPTDDPAWRHLYADEAWSCALRFRAALFYLRVPHELITCPYRSRPGKAVIDVANVARHYGALVEGKAALAKYQPTPGDAACSMGPAGPHVSCVTAASWQRGPGNSDASLLDCVDGGQGRRGSMAIEWNQYLHTGLALRSTEKPHSLAAPGPVRPLVWFVDLFTLLLNAGVLVG